MRNDFHSVVTDDRGHRYSYVRDKRVDIVDEDGDRLPWHASDRHLGWRERSPIRYSLIKRFLTSRVGRRFDDVRSEFVASLRHSPLRDDLLDYLLDRVENPRGCSATGIPRRIHGFGYCEPFYVDDAGILRAQRRARNHQYRTRTLLRLLLDPEVLPVSDPTLPLDEVVSLNRLGGVWYETRVRRVRVAAAMRGSVTVWEYGERVAFDELPVLKRQLPSEGIRRLRLDDWERDSEALAMSIDGSRHDADARIRLEGLRKAAASRLRVPLDHVGRASHVRG